MLIGEFVIKRNGKLERYNKFDDIPSSFEHLISFKPDYPPEPHTEEQHNQIVKSGVLDKKEISRAHAQAKSAAGHLSLGTQMKQKRQFEIPSTLRWN